MNIHTRMSEEDLKWVSAERGIYIFWIGIYFYIGHSTNIRRRLRRHLSMMKNGKHYNRQIQKAWDDDRNFQFSILHYFDFEASKELLFRWEQKFLDLFSSHINCLNVSKVADSIHYKIRKQKKARKGIIDQRDFI